VARESVRLAFVAALQHLPARQRAVLLLRDVLAWHAAEVAELLGTSTVAVNSALQRARAQLKAVHLGELTEPDDPVVRATVERFVRAFERSDVSALAALLRDDAQLEMPPNRAWFRGADAVSAFFADRVLGSPGSWRLVEVAANGQPAVASYLRHDDGAWRAHGVTVLEVVDGRLARLVAFLDPALVPIFGLPDQLPDQLPDPLTNLLPGQSSAPR
jgi:RNA polymerase sigma-70 factor (ECF subfamily)